MRLERLPRPAVDDLHVVELLLARLPTWRGRETLLVAADVPGAELRRIERLPRGLDARALTRILHADPRRFFPRDTASLCIGAVGELDGAHAVAAVERELIETCSAIVVARDIRLVGVLPARALMNGTDDASLLAVAALERGARSPFLVRDPRRAREASASRTMLAASACTLAAAFALAASPLHDLAEARALERQFDVMSAERGHADAAERELSRTTSEVRELDAFARRIPSMTLRLASLARHLEAPTTLRSLQLDSLGGSAVAMTTHAAELTDMLAEVPEIANARIVGPIVTETASVRTTATPPMPDPALMGAGGATTPTSTSQATERVTIRFEWARGAR